MNTNVLVQSVLENHGGVIKGSSKRITSYVVLLLISFVIVFAILNGKSVDMDLLMYLGGILLTLLGFGTFSPKPAVAPDKAADAAIK